MKIKFLIAFLFFTNYLTAQTSNNWELEISFRNQFELNENVHTVEFGKTGRGIQQYKLGINRKIYERPKLNIYLGLGVSRERMSETFVINHCYQQDLCISLFKATNAYSVDLVEFKSNINFYLTNKLNLGFDIIPQIKFHQNITVANQNKFSFRFHRIEIFPKVSYDWKDLKFSLGYRVLNIQRNDPVVELETPIVFYNPDLYESIEYTNRSKIQFSIAYVLK